MFIVDHTMGGLTVLSLRNVANNYPSNLSVSSFIFISSSVFSQVHIRNLEHRINSSGEMALSQFAHSIQVPKANKTWGGNSLYHPSSHCPANANLSV
jgi:hypothetical protein